MPNFWRTYGNKANRAKYQTIVSKVVTISEQLALPRMRTRPRS